ncbi:rare lipoprotein A [Luteibacter sp. Sphag1AF]|uniref:septal ring lytic transglycosylase RlpA family protein n=1 Tax=Luteibacter sp. Sphag1AF TaxID=2587031 RepID=UPI00161ADCCE|nr:septal ring lytic transglycosylase RlpA family protein [Luteibacter sp. Sphag1AF]MBB3227745.1 rare lipoprotein A [Luteibacter sp. Sphag1AF]
MSSRGAQKAGAPTPRFGRIAALLLLCALVALIAGCGGSKNKRPSRGSSSASASKYPRGSGRNDDIRKSQGSRYSVDNDSVPTEIPDVSKLPEPVPKVEPRALYGNKSPYSVLGKSYNVLPSPNGYVERGIASFYGNKFHGYKTSSLEEYDMYQFSAAHKTLPLPSYARVTNLENGRSVIVRINDRGPFHENRIIDLSFAAAVKLGVWPKGTGLVEVRAIDPEHPEESGPAPLLTTPPPRSAPVAAPVVVAARPPTTVVPAGNPAVQTLPTRSVPAPASPAPVTVASSSSELLPPLPTRLPSSAVPAGTPVIEPKPSIYLQVGAFSDLANASRVADQLNRAGLGPVSVVEASINGRSVRRVRVGPLADVDTADRVTDQIAGMGLPRPQVAVD